MRSSEVRAPYRNVDSADGGHWFKSFRMDLIASTGQGMSINTPNVPATINDLRRSTVSDVELLGAFLFLISGEATKEGVSMQHEDRPPDQAYRDFVTLRNRAIASVANNRSLPTFVSSVLPDRLQRQLKRAVAGCETAYEVRMIFASVQEHQLCGSHS